jgi:hypothetical protein
MERTTKVSNTLMGRSHAVVLLLVSLSFIPAFSQMIGNRRDTALVDKANKAIISAFDPALPNITLESFLKYETQDPVIDWRVLSCTAALFGDRSKGGGGTCVQTYSDLLDNRVIAILIRINLIELPAAIHGAKPKSRTPRDLLPLHRVA